MRVTKYLFIAIGFLLIPGVAAAQGGEPLPLAEAGSPEAARLNQAHESDLQGALEEPGVAARRTQRLRRQEGRSGGYAAPAPAPEPAYSPPAPAPEPSYAPPPSSSVSGGSDLQLEAPGPASRRDARMRWKKQGHVSSTPVYRPTYSAPRYRYSSSSSSRSRSSQVKIVEPSDSYFIATPPFLFSAWVTDLSHRNRRILNNIAALMKEKPNKVPKLLIEAYTDNSGDAAANQALTVARANVVKAYLIKQGIGVHRLDAKGLGDANPVESNESLAGRAKNRRVEFKIIK